MAPLLPPVSQVMSLLPGVDASFQLEFLGITKVFYKKTLLKGGLCSQTTIQISPDQSLLERRITLGHEIAHLLLYKIQIDYPGKRKRDNDTEVWCEAFGKQWARRNRESANWVLSHLPWQPGKHRLILVAARELAPSQKISLQCGQLKLPF